MTATDGGNAVFAGAKNCPCHRAIRPTWMWEMRILQEQKSAVLPEHMRSLPSMAPRYTVHPEHKKPGYAFAHRALIFRFSEQLI